MEGLSNFVWAGRRVKQGFDGRGINVGTLLNNGIEE